VLNRNPVTLTPSIVSRTSPLIGSQTNTITIVQQPAENGQALANRVLQALRDRARSQSGDTLDWRLF
jgi:hypothetical protein